MAQPKPVKVCTLGESGAGKSSLIMRLTTGNFSSNQVRAFLSVSPVRVWSRAEPQISHDNCLKSYSKQQLGQHSSLGHLLTAKLVWKYGELPLPRGREASRMNVTFPSLTQFRAI